MSITNRVKEWLRPSPRVFAKKIIGDQPFNVIDVGAANGLNPHWQPLDGFAHIYAFEPHPESAEKLQYKYNKSAYRNLYHIIPAGLSRTGGPAILYMLNAPTGSSILPVDMDSPLVQKEDAYIFPIKELPIETQSLEQAMLENNIAHCDMIKLDVQGAELDIVLGMGEQHLNNLLSIEMEVGFQSVYKGAPKPYEVDAALAPYGFELFDLNLEKHFAKKNGNPGYYADLLGQSPLFGTINGKLLECDMLFIKKPELILATKDKQAIGRYIAVLCMYSLYTHALQMADAATEKGIINAAEKEHIYIQVKKWSNNNRPFFRRPVFSGLYAFVAKIKSHIGHKAWHRQ